MRELHYHPTEALLQEREEFVKEVFELCFGFCALPHELNNEDHVPEDKMRPSYSYDEALERLKELDKHAYAYEEQEGLL